MQLGRDFRLGLRALRREPGFAITAIVTLALGIGANAAMVGLVDRMLLSPPPGIPDAHRVVRLELGFTGESGEHFAMQTTSFPVFTDLATRSRSYSSVAAVAKASMVLGHGEAARFVAGAKVSGQYFGVLGAEPALGRFFGEAEDAPPRGTPVAVLGHSFWRREFGSDRTVLGRELVLDDIAYQVIGVAPADFTGEGHESVDVWVPLSAAEAVDPGWRETRGLNIVSLVARLRDRIEPAAAEAEGTLILRAGQRAVPDPDETVRLEVHGIVSGLSDQSTSGRIALWLAAVSFAVFIIAVANVTNLTVVQTVRRRRELAVRAALGASRAALIRQLAVESLLVAVLGGAAALVVAVTASEAVRAVLIPSLVASEQLIPGKLLWLTILGSLAGAALIGVVPALRASRPSVIDDLKAGGQGATAHRTPLLSALLVVQSSLSVILLVGAGLFGSSLNRVRAQDLGFTPKDVYMASMAWHGTVGGTTQDALYRQAEAAVRRVPGVLQASVAQSVPFGAHHVPPISVPGRANFPDPRRQLPFLYGATPSYFRVLGLRLLQGRAFTDQDREGSALVVIVNEAMARGVWPGESPLGKCVRAGFAPGEEPTGPAAAPSLPCRTVIGVVNNARPRSIRPEEGQATMQYYVPFGQVPPPPDVVQPRPGEISSLLIRTDGAPGVSELVRRMMQGFAPGLPITEIVALQDVLDRQIRPWTLGATVFSGLGLLALVLVTVGLYGVRAYLVAQRTKEIGVRLALGATPRAMVRLVLFEGLRVTGLGLAIGLVVALGAGPWIEPLLFETTARDLTTFLAVGLSLTAVALAAGLIPAIRAASVKPGEALRAE